MFSVRLSVHSSVKLVKLNTIFPKRINRFKTSTNIFLRISYFIPDCLLRIMGFSFGFLMLVGYLLTFLQSADLER